MNPAGFSFRDRSVPSRLRPVGHHDGFPSSPRGCAATRLFSPAKSTAVLGNVSRPCPSCAWFQEHLRSPGLQPAPRQSKLHVPGAQRSGSSPLDQHFLLSDEVWRLFMKVPTSKPSQELNPASARAGAEQSIRSLGGTGVIPHLGPSCFVELRGSPGTSGLTQGAEHSPAPNPTAGTWGFEEQRPERSELCPGHSRSR